MCTDRQKIPERLYRYRSFNEEWLKDIFTKNVLYYPSPGDFNDPFDCSPMITFRDADDDEINKYIESFKNYFVLHSYSDWIAYKYDLFIKIKNDDPDTTKYLYEVMKRKIIPKINNDYGILSMSSSSKNILMWSHYSNSHKGICLELDYNIVNNPQKVRGLCYKIIYCPSFLTLHEYVNHKYKNFVEEILTRKADHWVYEDEWRLITIIDEYNPRKRPYPPEMLTGIIFGCDMKEEHKTLIREWIAHRAPKPQLYEAKINNERYALDIVPIE